MIARLNKITAMAGGLLHAINMYCVIPGLVILVSIDVALRYVFARPLQWGNETASLMLLIVFLASLPRCTRERSHIFMELFYDKFSGAMRRLSDALTAVAGFCVSVALGWRATLSVGEMIRYNEGAEFIDLPFWPFAALMAFAAALMALEFLLQFFAAVLDRNLPGIARAPAKLE